MKTETVKLRWHLYHWGDRAYEDCYAEIVAEVPDTWRKTMPAEDEVKVISVTVEDDSQKFLVGVYRTDMALLHKDLLEYADAELVIDTLSESDEIEEDGWL